MDGDFDGSLPAPVVAENASASGTAFYEKGAAVNRMFATHLGQDNWYDALSYHLRLHQYSNPQLPNLIASFKDTLPSKFAGFGTNMASWPVQSQIRNQNGATSRFGMCFDPTTLGAAGGNTSRIQYKESLKLPFFNF